MFEERARAFAVLDGASVPDLPTKIYEMQPHAVCLYRGELEPDMAEVAPYLVELFPDTTFTDWLLSEGLGGKHWGIFARSPFSLTELRKHFRKFLTVYDETGNPLLFRYYDPRVLVKFLPTCDQESLDKLFGRVTEYAAEDGTENFMRFELQNGKLNSETI
ncbi:MAG TPA: DUF4123 domain-containing protein [Pyrinomonadaceae bacterium]